MLSVCLSVCTSQALSAAYQDLEEAVREYDNPDGVNEKLPLIASAKGSPLPPKAEPPLPLPAATKAELDLKGVKLEEQASEMKVMQSKIDDMGAKAKSDMNFIIEGAKAQGVCMYPHLH